ncbi:MAG: two-component system response regulator [Candidatus Brocadia sp.]|jgi:Response regulator containing CheY-like receiver, AAA-type ATPase, and DNA-binding domains|uniref:Chemotaxis protein CheY n=1 Tax=Candidatus Brocadia fulgida TaxID=380242 RepID=A0A0M2US79_9BACT|nr:MAG: chemotaxis protein CheY [Candidatus Brocadia fulgida]MCC6325116.1 response regulator [Candidatus Brocadia sp.]MCE7910478.1 response regulator [Candidatus Brocadia sp. AMX3]MBV6519783.1 Chemotaxis protein CheY [Candidatus Brocadia fulgida]MDG5995421.1 response regulator [Candidatus Brocadia sp.]
MKKILVVDDSKVIRMVIKRLLTQHGYQIAGEAENGRAAFEKYKDLRPDAVTMDIIMPEVDGIQGLKDILSFDKQAKVIMISAIDQKESLLEAIRQGAADYVVKPFEDDRMVAAMKNIFDENQKDAGGSRQ